MMKINIFCIPSIALVAMGSAILTLTYAMAAAGISIVY
jgi:hypothetical protein